MLLNKPGSNGMSSKPSSTAMHEQEMLSPPLPDVRIFLLGRFEVVRGDRVLRAGDWTRRKAQTLLARLALELSNVLYNIAQLHWHRSEYQAAFDVAQRSLAVAERLNDPAAIARAFEMLALACHSLGEWQTGIGYEQQRMALAGPGLDVSDAFDVHL